VIGWVLAMLACCVVALVGFRFLSTGEEAQGRVLAAPVIVQSSDFLIAPIARIPGVYECTAAAGPANDKSEHPIAITTGQGLQLINFFATLEGVKLNTVKVTALPKANNLWHGTDNNLIRTESGEFLVEYDSASARGFNGHPPSWSKDEVTFRAVTRPGMRGVVGFVASSGHGQDWAPSPPLDLEFIAGGIYDQPRPMSNSGTIDVPIAKQGKNGDGTKKWWIGGEDRTELYACPYTGNTYVTTRVISGTTGTGPKQNTTLVLGRIDGDKGWKLVTTTPGWSPTVMTSTPDGRLWLMQNVGTGNQLTYSGPTGRNRLPDSFTSKSPSYNGEAVAWPTAVAMELKANSPSIARLIDDRGSSSVLISYQVKNSDGNQEFRIVKATVDFSGGFSTTNEAAIRAAAPKSQSVMYGAFIQPELLGEPKSAASDSTLFYWLDAPRTAGKMPYAARYAYFKGGELHASGYLSTANGKRRTWKTLQNPGDYMKGASWVEKDGTVAFIPQWLEPDGMHGNLVIAGK